MSSDLFNLLVAVKSQELYVILLRDDDGKLTLLVDPGMNRPWSSKNKRLADFHAKSCNGEARTYADAWSLLMKDCPDFEKRLIERIQKRQEGKHPKSNARRN